MGFKVLLQPANFTLGPDASLNREIQKNSVRIEAPNSMSMHQSENIKNQIMYNDKQRWVLMANSVLYARVNEN